MKIYLSVFLSLFITFGFSQNDNPDNLRAKVFELKVKTVPPGNLQLPFEAIKVIDSRADTSKLGFRITKKVRVTVNRVFEKIQLKPGIEKGIENFYNEYYKNNFTPNGKTLLISVRKFWINSLPDRQGEHQIKNIDRLSQQDIYARFEYYLGPANAYVPLKRIDTIFQLTPLVKVEDYDPSDEKQLPFLCFALEKMVENVNYNAQLKDFEKKIKMSIDDIIKYNATNRNLPILQEPVKKGVFITLDEFKNNQPSVTTFTKRKVPGKNMYEIVDEKGNVILHYFAYYDGGKLAIFKSLSTLFASKISQDNYGVYRVGTSFQFFENHFLSSRQEIGVWDNSELKNSTNSGGYIVWVPRQIDLETGEIY